MQRLQFLVDINHYFLLYIIKGFRKHARYFSILDTINSNLKLNFINVNQLLWHCVTFNDRLMSFINVFTCGHAHLESKITVLVDAVMEAESITIPSCFVYEKHSFPPCSLRAARIIPIISIPGSLRVVPWEFSLCAFTAAHSLEENHGTSLPVLTPWPTYQITIRSQDHPCFVLFKYHFVFLIVSLLRYWRFIHGET